MAITQEARIETYGDAMEANAHLMEEVYNDAKLSASQKLRDFSLGVRSQVLMSRDLASRRKEMVSYGMKIDANIGTLAFNPADDKTA